MTNNEINILDRRNRLFVKILWALLLLGIVFNLAAGGTLEMQMLLIAICLPAAAVATWLTYKQIAIKYVMYFISTIMIVLTVVLMLSDPNPIFSTYTLFYISMGLMTLYSNYRPVLYTGVLSIAGTIYVVQDPQLHEALYKNEPLIYLLLYLILMMIVLCAAAIFSEKLQAQVLHREGEAVLAKEHSDELLQEIHHSVTVLNGFSSEQKQRVTTTSTISREVTQTFSQLSSTIEHQAVSIRDITESVHVVEQTLENVVERTEELDTAASETLALTQQGSQETDTLVQEMGRVQAMMQDNAEMMNALNAQTEQVSMIVSTISDISSQTHLLSLNAAIEAAQAGEHGRGFAVVSGEIRKLADHARQATEEIRSILEDVQEQIHRAAEMVNEGQTAISSGVDATSQVAQIMTHITDNTEQVHNQVDFMRDAVIGMTAQYHQMAQGMITIAGSTEQHMAAVEEVLASMEYQNDQIKALVQGYDMLDNHVTSLHHMADEEQ